MCIRRYIPVYVQPTLCFSWIWYSRTNRYNCSISSISLFFFSLVYVYIYLVYIYVYMYTLLFLVFFSFSRAPSLFPFFQYVLVIGVIFQLTGLTEAISNCLGREFFAKRFTGSALGSVKSRKQENGRSMRGN